MIHTAQRARLIGQRIRLPREHDRAARDAFCALIGQLHRRIIENRLSVGSSSCCASPVCAARSTASKPQHWSSVYAPRARADQAVHHRERPERLAQVVHQRAHISALLTTSRSMPFCASSS